MPPISKWMMGFGVLLLASSIGAWFIGEYDVRAGFANGLAMLAAGAGAAQGRRSVRRAGLLVGFIIPALMAFVFGWRAVEQLRLYNANATKWWPVVYSGAIATAASIVLIVLLRLRAGKQSEIEERGYSLTTPAHVRAVSSELQPPTNRA